jgi:hypothetical protein
VITIIREHASALPDDRDHTETCWRCFNVNFNVNFKIVFKTILLCVSWWIKETLIVSRCTALFVIINIKLIYTPTLQELLRELPDDGA